MPKGNQSREYVTYNHNPATLEVAEGQVAGKFRGQKWATHNLKQVPVIKHAENLVYRGVPIK